MLTVEQYETQIKNLIVMIINKERKKINKWKKEEDWTIDDGLVSDVDVFYHLFNFIEYQGGINNFFAYINFIDEVGWDGTTPVNSECKWKTIKKKNEFFDTFLL